MSYFNKIILIGNLTRDPELSYTPAGTGVANFGLACNRRYGDKQETMFVDVVAFAKLAETVAQYCNKGKLVLVEGRLDQDRWEDKTTGVKRSKHKITAGVITFLDGAKASTPDNGQGDEYGDRF